MSWPLQEDFKPGEPMVQVPMDWFNTVSKILNTLVTVGCTLERTASPSQETPWRLIVEAAAAAGAELSNYSPLADAATASAGTGTKASREDHVHPVNVDDSVDPADTADAADPGTSDRYARADHVHKGGGGVDLDTITPLVDGVAAVGNSTKAAHGNHVHPLNVDSSLPSSVGPTAGDSGDSSVYARRDHKHRVICVMPTGLSVTNLFPTNAAQTTAHSTTFDAATYQSQSRYALVRIVTRTVFNTAVTPPTLLEFYREVTVLPSGQIVAISGEGLRTIATTVTHA